MAQVIASENPLVRASTPNESPISPAEAAKMSAARQGLAWVGVVIAGLSARPSTRRAFVR